MSNDTQPRDRNAEFRRALVATVDLSPYVRRRPSFRLVVALAASFALAGALTGGAIATVAKPDPQLLEAQAQAASSGKGSVGFSDGQLIGHPFVRSASGTQSIDVGRKPAGATTLIEGFGCLDAGRIVGFLDSRKLHTFDDCSSDSSGGGPLTVSGHGDHVVTYRTHTGVRYAVWLSWARIPQFTASATQTKALADGVVTRDEEVAAFDRYAGCMGALGHPTDSDGTVIIPGSFTSNSAIVDGSVTRCRVTEYNDVDIKWRQELEASTVGVASVAACTAQIGVRNKDSAAVIATIGPDVVNLGSCPWIG